MSASPVWSAIIRAPSSGTTLKITRSSSALVAPVVGEPLDDHVRVRLPLDELERPVPTGARLKPSPCFWTAVGETMPI